MEGKLTDCATIFKNRQMGDKEYVMGTAAKIQVWEKVTLDRPYVEVPQMRTCVWKEVDRAMICFELTAETN